MIGMTSTKIIITDQKIPHAQLKEVCDSWFGDMVKITVDIKKRMIGIGGELHADAEALLIERGSRSDDIWGINFYPWLPRENRIEFSALINIRPRQDNPSLEIKDQNVRASIKQIVEDLVLGSDEKLV
jgi:hypothetical protein